MKSIIKISKLELHVLFYSPISWLILIVFAVQTGLAFNHYLVMYASDQEAGWQSWSLTSKIFCSFTPNAGVIVAAAKNLFLYIPLLTMGLISKDLSSGTIRLLQSSPVTSLQIVLGKYLAVAAYGLLLPAILLLILAGGMFSIYEPDSLLVLSGIIGIYLLILSYSAIGLFISSLTSYQTISGLATLAVLSTLNFMGEFGQNIDFVRDLTFALRLLPRSDQFTHGLISSKNLVYFFSIVFLFIGLTTLRLEGIRKPGFNVAKLLNYLLIFLVCAITAYVSAIPGLTNYVDMTANKSETISENSQKILKSVPSPLKFHTLVNILDGSHAYLALPDMKNSMMEFFEQYQRFAPDMTIDYTYYYDTANDSWIFQNFQGKNLKEIAKKYSSVIDFEFSHLLKPGETKKVADLKDGEGRLVWQVEAGGNKTILRVFDDIVTLPTETEVDNALKRLTSPVPLIAFLAGNGERSITRDGDNDYRTFSNRPGERHSLINQGFDVKELFIDSAEIPDNITALVIADPLTSYSKDIFSKIERYLKSGGNMLIAGEPGRQDILNPILSVLNVQIESDTLHSDNRNFSSELIFGRVLKSNTNSGPVFPAKGESFVLSMPGATGIIFPKVGLFQINPLIESTSKSVEKNTPPIMISLTRAFSKDKIQKIIISGDADFLSNRELIRKEPGDLWNRDFGISLFKWLANGEFPVDNIRIDSRDNKLRVTWKQASYIGLTFVGLIPMMIAGVGVIFLVRRKMN